MSKKPKVNKLPNVNNPFVLIQVIMLMLIRLTAIVLGGILSILSLAVHKWVASLIIVAFVLVILYTLGVI